MRISIEPIEDALHDGQLRVLREAGPLQRPRVRAAIRQDTPRSPARDRDRDRRRRGRMVRTDLPLPRGSVEDDREGDWSGRRQDRPRREATGTDLRRLDRLLVARFRRCRPRPSLRPRHHRRGWHRPRPRSGVAGDDPSDARRPAGRRLVPRDAERPELLPPMLRAWSDRGRRLEILATPDDDEPDDPRGGDRGGQEGTTEAGLRAGVPRHPGRRRRQPVRSRRDRAVRRRSLDRPCRRDRHRPREVR
jgi:hypothetical protein